MPCSAWVLSVAGVVALFSTSSAQVIRLAEITTRDIDRLDRSKTAVIIPGGILEQHGPYLPSFTDGYLNQDLTEALATAFASKGWTALLFPQIPLGVGGANEIGKKHVFPGTYAVRSTTLRSVFMDLASELGEQGFQWVFIVHLHGAPNHNRALDQASDFFRQTYGGHMVHLTGFVPQASAVARRQEIVEADGLSPHAGMMETSWMLHLRGELVARDLREAIDQTARSWTDAIRLAGARAWPGYFGAPRYATAEFGTQHWRMLREWYVDLAQRILDGYDYSVLPRRGTLAASNPANVEIDEAALAREREMERKQSAWLGDSQTVAIESVLVGASRS